MALTQEQQLLKDNAIKEEKRAFLFQTIQLSGELRSIFYNAQALLTKYFNEQYGSNLTESDLAEFPLEPADVVALMGALQEITTEAQANDKQWLQKVAKVAKPQPL